MIFYVGLHHPSDAKHFSHAFVSINAIRDRKSDFPVSSWIMDSGAFSEVSEHGRHRFSPEKYAEEIERWRTCGSMELAVCQDWMCEPHICARTGYSVAQHQALTVDRYDSLRAATDAPLMPVLQGFKPAEYLACLELYGGRLKEGMRVGVGSICKRNGHPAMIEHILKLIKQRRPDLRLHGFGLKLQAISRTNISNLLYSADSMAWSDAARKEANPLRRALEKETGSKMTPKQAREIWAARGVKMPNPNDWREAQLYVDRIKSLHATSACSSSHANGTQNPTERIAMPNDARDSHPAVETVLPDVSQSDRWF